MMHILFLAGREITYPRNDVLLRALRRLGDVDIIGGSEKGSILYRSIKVSIQSIQSLRSRKYDLVFVGFYGQLLMFPVQFLSRVPILFDAFISTYDTLCFDRQVFSPKSIVGKLAYKIDKLACERANHILLDTVQHIQYFQDTYHLPQALFSGLPVGCNEDLFFPHEKAQSTKDRILFYSTYMPLHGVETILQSAAFLQEWQNLEFRLIGDGPGLKQAKVLAHTLGLKNVQFILSMPTNDLVGEIAAATICLGGHFGRTAKADRVVPSKVYQLMVMAKPIVAGDTSANRGLLSDGDSALLCPPGDPTLLAEAIHALHSDTLLREKLGKGARERFMTTCSEAIITQKLDEIIKKILCR